jgi:hypothetical protein
MAWPGAELQDFAKQTSEAAEFDDEEEEESEDEDDEDVRPSAADVQLSWLFANGTIGGSHEMVRKIVCTSKTYHKKLLVTCNNQFFIASLV